MVKIWIEAFWKPRPEGGDTGNPPSGNLRARWSATLALVALITLIGLAPEPMLNWSHQAATEVLAYRNSVVTAEVSP